MTVRDFDPIVDYIKVLILTQDHSLAIVYVVLAELILQHDYLLVGMVADVTVKSSRNKE